MIEPVSIIVPTWNNPDYLYQMIRSVGGTRNYYPLKIIVVNNGSPEVMDPIKNVDIVKVVQCKENLGWEGGLKEGLKHVDTEFVMFANDDIHVPYSSNSWLRCMMHYFNDPKVGAVGPTSNCVMGPQQIFSPISNGPSFYGNYLIGFCMLLRKSALEAAGGVDDTLPGGDDLDLSIRLKDAGYKLLVCRESFVYHHGFKTGERVHGGPDNGGWNSAQMTERTNQALIKKHGLRKWFETLHSPLEVPEFNIAGDTEGNVIRHLIDDGSVLELGCGGQKTVERALGVDYYAKGETIPTIAKVSVADIVSSVNDLSVLGSRKFDNIIARHILEHMMDPIKSLEYWMSYLNPGGTMFIAVPDDTICDSISLNPEHKHAFTKESITNLFKKVGLINTEIYDPENNHSMVAVAKVPVNKWKMEAVA